MTKQNAIRYYRKFSAADAYIIGFEYKHEVYVAVVDEIMPRLLRVERESSSKGGKEKLCDDGYNAWRYITNSDCDWRNYAGKYLNGI